MPLCKDSGWLTVVHRSVNVLKRLNTLLSVLFINSQVKDDLIYIRHIKNAEEKRELMFKARLSLARVLACMLQLAPDNQVVKSLCLLFIVC